MVEPIKDKLIAFWFFRTVFFVCFAFLTLTQFFYLINTASADPFGTDLGSFDGVIVKSNGTSGYYSGINHYEGGIYTGVEWQCVEYVRRFYLKKYGIDLGSISLSTP